MPNWVQNVLAFLGALYIKLFSATTRWKIVGEEHIKPYLKEGGPGVLVCFWHNQLMIASSRWCYKKPFYMVISASSDGQLISKTVNYLRIRTIAASKKKAHFRDLKILIDRLRKGDVIGITPDGPKGPIHQVSSGVVTASYLAQAHILPIALAVSLKKTCSSWDRFIMPFPFGKGTIIWGKPIMPPRTKEECVVVADALSKNLKNLTKDAETSLI